MDEEVVCTWCVAQETVSGVAEEELMYELIKQSSARAWACLTRLSSGSVSH